ncbi:cobalamin biosynthesis protein, partial [Streptomyces griseolus]|uniref:cobalamin biosynthesis protein n=1 Tax=Streptomyces griseolus TaxID=1909 RepID=UPI00224495DE
MTRHTLVVGVGARRGVPAEEVVGLILTTLGAAGLRVADVVALATLDVRADEPGLVGAATRLGLPVRPYPAEVLARVRVPNPSRAARAAVSTGSVAEAAALAGAGAG